MRPADLRLLGDENIAPRTVAALRAQGFDVVRARERGLRGRPDVEVFAEAFADGRVVLSHDTDFGLDLDLEPPFIVVLEPGRVRVRSLS